MPDLTIDMVKDSIKAVLDKKSAEINAIINAQDPALLTGDQAAIYQLMNTGAYPAANVDLYTMVASSGNMLTTLADTILWYNRTNATSKYSFILENYLDRDGNRDYPLSGHHSDYEMGYIGGPGDAQNMYVKVDPESKGTLSKDITDIQADYGSLVNLLDAANVAEYSPEDSQFKCGPPEGVVIWKWLPAVFCWLGTILPPTISAGSCGPQLGSDTDKGQDRDFFTSIPGTDGKLAWQQDLDHNGILDGYEWVKDGEIKLAASLKRIGYRSGAALTADLTKDGRILAHDSYNQVFFDVKKITLLKGQNDLEGNPVTSDKIVYVRGGTGAAGSIETLKKYVFFTPIAVRAEAGTATYGIQSIDRDIDIDIVATVAPKDKNGNVAFSKDSNLITLKVRDEALKIGTEIQETTGTGSRVDPTFKAGDASKITFKFTVSGKNPETPTAAKSPIKIKILDDVDGTELTPRPADIGSDTFIYAGNLLKQAGNYRFEFVDAEDRYGTVMVNVLPGDPFKIEAVAASNMFVKGQKNMVLVTVKDRFDNYVKGDLLQVAGTVDGGAYFTENHDAANSKSTVEGVLSFEMSADAGSTGNNTHKLDFSTVDSKGATIKMATPLTVQSIDYAKIQVNVANRGSLVAGGSGQTVTLKITDNLGQVLTGFNGVASLDFPKNSGFFSTPFVQITNGTNSGALTFTPGTVAILDAKIDVQVPGIVDVEGGTLSILPNVPMRVGLLSDTAKFEAKVGNSAGITAQLFDRYGNIAYNHPAGMSANFTIPSGYGKYGSISGGNVPFANGEAKVQINSSSSPGTLYYMVEVAPGLETNTFTIEGENIDTTPPTKTSVTIKGYSKNVAYIESYYLWNAEKLAKTNYNVLSTTLLGADYGNVTVPNYLAGELIFNSGSSSMAVTTLLGNAEKRDEIVQMTPGGKIVLDRGQTAEVQIGSNKNRTTLDIFDPFKRENIGRFYLNTSPATPTFACATDEADEIDACDFQGKESYMVLKGLGEAEVTKIGNRLSLGFDGIPVFEISPDGTITKYPNVTVEADGEESRNLLSLSIVSSGIKIGRLGIKWDAPEIIVSSPSTLDAALASHPGTIVYEGISPRYGIKQDNLGNTSAGDKGLKIFAQSEDVETDRDLIGSSGKLGYEEYAKNKGIGFGDGNNTQLEFASQSTVGQSAKSFATYSEIVIGDPVARLPEILSPQNFDRTLGKRLMSSAGGIIESYSTIDYNRDNMQDIVVFYQDGKVELLQNYR